jgi:hypothetical protein
MSGGQQPPFAATFLNLLCCEKHSDLLIKSGPLLLMHSLFSSHAEPLAVY